MIEPVPSATSQKLVLGQQSNKLKKAEQNKGIQMHLGSNVKLSFFFT